MGSAPALGCIRPRPAVGTPRAPAIKRGDDTNITIRGYPFGYGERTRLACCG